MVLIPNNESFDVSASGVVVSKHVGLFKKHMDSMILGGTTITLDLPSGSTDCPSPTCKYNPTYDQFMDVNAAICQSCFGKGKVFQHRQTNYHCNRRWSDEKIANPITGGQNTDGGRIHMNLVRVKSHISSFDDITKCTGATIDSQKISLYEEPRKTGWNGTNLYVVSWWQRASKKNNG